MQTHIIKTPVSVKLPPPLLERVKKLAEARNQSAHAVMLQAIKTYVEREEQRESLRQEAKAAHEHYMLTGLHVTNDEIGAWIESIARGEKAPMPKCHI